uniref:Uncharacterized protein n=1 Tax=Brassica oleracea TaxID=3712 RepID=A0A3P6DW87_BRAOL|nr:unnamed protein product [Brassica oleracea]
MAMVMKQQDRAEEAIEAIKSLRVWCSDQAHESLDNILLDLYKDSPLTGKRTKTAGSQGKKFQVSFEQEATRLLGNLGWALMQRDNFVEAEDAYRRALSIAPDSNKMCNLGICLMKQGMINETKETLQLVKPAVVDGPRGVDSHLKACERAQQMLITILVEQRRLFDTMFVLNNPLRVDAKPFFSSKLINNKEKLKRTRSSSQTMGMLSFGGGDEGERNTKEKKAIDYGLLDSKEFEEAVIMAVLGIETKVLDKKRLKVFQDITLSSISPRA